MAQFDLFRIPPRPRTTGRMIGPKPALKPKHIWAIRHHLKTASASVRASKSTIRLSRPPLRWRRRQPEPSALCRRQQPFAGKLASIDQPSQPEQ